MAGPKLNLPVAVTVFPPGHPRLPRSWIEDTYANLIHYCEADKGGHFAAFEQPEILVSEIRTGLRSLRVACQQHGTTLRDFLPRAWDHPVASYGTTRRVVPGILVAGRYGCLQVDRLGGSGDGVPGGRGD